MASLFETQRLLRDAVVTGDMRGAAPLLVGGRHPERRVAIHHRHYEASLVRALLDRFPATAWLVGTPFLAEAAQRFVREHPPSAPCVAEYGEGFAEFLATRPGAERVPYLRDFAELESAIGAVSLAVDRPPVTAAELSAITLDVLPDIGLRLQPGVRYLHARWPVDRIMRLYLTETAPDQLLLDPADTWIEIRGARGVFDVGCLDVGEFTFRAAIAGGQTIGLAAERALDRTAGFDPGRALASLVAGGLITALNWRLEVDAS